MIPWRWPIVVVLVALVTSCTSLVWHAQAIDAAVKIERQR